MAYSPTTFRFLTASTPDRTVAMSPSPPSATTVFTSQHLWRSRVTDWRMFCSADRRPPARIREGVHKGVSEGTARDTRSTRFGGAHRGARDTSGCHRAWAHRLAVGLGCQQVWFSSNRI